MKNRLGMRTQTPTDRFEQYVLRTYLAWLGIVPQSYRNAPHTCTDLRLISLIVIASDRCCDRTQSVGGSPTPAHNYRMSVARFSAFTAIISIV